MKKKESRELLFIKSITKESVNKICKKYHIDMSNLLANRVKEDKVRLVYSELIYDLLSNIVSDARLLYVDRSQEYYELKYGEDYGEDSIL